MDRETRRRLEALRDQWRARSLKLLQQSDGQGNTQYALRLAAEAEGIDRCVDQLDNEMAALPAAPPPELDGPRLKTALDEEYAKALAVIHRQQVAHAALVALVRRMLALLTNTAEFDQRATTAWVVERAAVVYAVDAALAEDTETP